MTSYWKQTAAKLTETPNPDWLELLRANLEDCHPEMLAELKSAGDLEAYLKVRVVSAQTDAEEMVKSGAADQQAANELAMQDLLRQAPEDEDETTEWEVEGATADIEAVAAKQLSQP